MIKLFIYLQILDIMTTVIALQQHGMGEMSPVISRLIPLMGLVPALLATKLAICGVVVGASQFGRTWAIAKGTYISAFVVAFNLCGMLL